MEIRVEHLSTRLGPESRIAFLALCVASTPPDEHCPFCLILGCGKDLFSDLGACSTFLRFIWKLISDSACSYAFSGSLAPDDYCWPQLSFPLHTEWMLSKQPFWIHAKRTGSFSVLLLTMLDFKYMTSPLQNWWGLPLLSYVVQLLPGSSCSTFLFIIYLSSLKCYAAPTSCAGSSTFLHWVIIGESQGKKNHTNVIYM